MTAVKKACPFVLRERGAGLEVLAFVHPLAGRQFVKGTVESGELPLSAALRELREESGVVLDALDSLGTHRIAGQVWYLFLARRDDLPETWTHEADDDGGHDFVFFWHPLGQPLDDRWEDIFHQAFAALQSRLSDKGS